jgi:hypothetical protein
MCREPYGVEEEGLGGGVGEGLAISFMHSYIFDILLIASYIP